MTNSHRLELEDPATKRGLRDQGATSTPSREGEVTLEACLTQVS